MHQNHPGFRIRTTLTNGPCLERGATRGSCLIISILSLLLMQEKWKHFADVVTLFTPRPRCAEYTAIPIEQWQTRKGSNPPEFLGDTKHITCCSSLCILVTYSLFCSSLFFFSFPSYCWPMLVPCFHKAVTFSCPYLLVFISNKQNFERLVQTVIKTILIFTQELRECSASDPIFIGEGGRMVLHFLS